MFIIVLLLGSILVPLTTQVEQRQIADAQKKLDEIKDALIGFAIANGRLPCPASASSAGAESLSGGGSCTTVNYDGFVPAVTLGITATNDQGFAVDPWGNRIRYAVTNANSNAFTTANGMSSTGLSALSPNLFVCSTATGIAINNCDTGKTLATGVPVVIYSTGKNGSYGGTDLDERANPNPNSSDNNRGFVYHTPTPSTATNGEFDDIMVWLSPNILYNRMVAAGKLP